MTPVDLLVTHGTVLTVDAVDTVIADGAVAIAGGEIVEVGPTAELTTEARVVLDAGGGIVMPGLVNAHTHLAMTMFRGYADDVGLQAFLGRVFPAEDRVLTAESVAVGTQLAIAEQLRAGITSALDMYWYPEASAAVADAAGFRLHHGPVFVGSAGPDRVPFGDRLRRLRLWFDAFADSDRSPRDGRWVLPHSTYTLDPDQLVSIADATRRLGGRLHIHAAENEAEVTTVVERHGRRPVELLDDIGLLGPDVVLAHTVHLSPGEIERIGATGTATVHNPASNLKLASGFAPVAALRAAGVTVALGTDGCASANDLDPFLAMRLAAIVAKAVNDDASVLSARDAMRMATVEGATALGLGDTLGTIEVGRRADVVVLHADRPHLVPSYDPASTVVYAAGRADVRHVVVDGRLVVHDGECLTVDVAGAMAAMRELAASVAS